MITAIVWLYVAWQAHWFVPMCLETSPRYSVTIYTRWAGVVCLLVGGILATIVVNR